MISKSMGNVSYQWLAGLARIVLGGVFVWGAIHKIKWPYMFLGNVYDYEIVGPQAGILIATVLPWLELFVGVCLLGNILFKGAILLATGMMGLFVFLHASVLYRGLGISCGCFSISESHPVSYASLIINCFLLMVCVIYFARTVEGGVLANLKRGVLRISPE